MRKFIIKNRQKRRYTKRQHVASSFSLPDLMLLGLIPAAFIAIVFLTMTSLKPSNFSLQLVTPSISLPLLYQSLIYFLKEIYNGLFQTITTISFPEIEVNYSPITPITKTDELSGLISQAFVDFLTLITQNAAIALNGISDMFSFIGASLNQIIQAIIHFFVSIFNFVEYLILELSHAIFTFFESLIRGVISVIELITGKIGSLVSSIINKIKLPFIVMGSYLEEMKPFFNFMRSSFQLAVNGLNTGLTDLLMIFNEIAKASSSS